MSTAAAAPETSTLFETAKGQKFGPSGVQGFTNANLINANPNAVSPNAQRWLFNPFARINVSERPVSGHLFLRPGAFIPISSQIDMKPDTIVPALMPGSAVSWGDNGQQKNGLATPEQIAAGYHAEVRSAEAIATELQSAYSDKGVVILESMTKFDDVAAVSALHQTLVEPGLTYTEDPHFPEHPIPNLIVLESHLAGQAMQDAHAIASDKLAIDPVRLVNELLGSVRQAISLCRTTTDEAQRVVANRTKGYTHTFDAWHKRCFIALGQTAPSDLPYERMQAVKTESNVQSSNGELDRLRAEIDALKADKYEREIAELRAENQRLKSGNGIVVESTASPKIENNTFTEPAQEIAQCSFIKKDGTQCKGRPNPETGRCPSHPLETEITEQGEQENGNSEETI